MGKKSKWQVIKSAWKYIVGLSTVCGIIGFFIQISGLIDLGSLIILPLQTFFLTGIPIYAVVLLAISIVLAYYVVKHVSKKTILDDIDARRIALLCQTPRTTDFLRAQYDSWTSQRSFVVLGSNGFDDYMRMLENEGNLKYTDGTWTVSKKALDYIRKYHGR